jgi:hypothetical protein
MRLTKIDVAEAHIVTAVRATFRAEHPASVYLLAASAREILTTIGHKTGVRTVLHGAAQDTGKKLVRLIHSAHSYANFMKHADKDPTAVIEGFEENEADAVLFIACHDFARIAGGQPIEMQVFEAWWFATAYAKVSTAPLRSQDIIRKCISRFPGIRAADRSGRQAIGLTTLETAAKNPAFAMEIRREVQMPTADRQEAIDRSMADRRSPGA